MQSDQRLCYCFFGKYYIKSCSIFWLVSAAEQAGLNITLSGTPKTGFCVTQPISEATCRNQRRPTRSYEKNLYKI